MLANVTLIVETFPESVLEIVRGTNAMIYLANAYCMTIHMKRDLAVAMGGKLPKAGGKDAGYADGIGAVRKLSL